MEINKELIQKAYKKLKSSVYYDKTQLALRNKIVEFEHKYPDVRLDKYLEKIYKALKDDNEFDKLANLICKKVSVTSLPKTLARNDKDIISNFTSNEIIISQLQHYIDMPVEGHIIGVLWIMLLGYRIDKTIYEYSYGNRIRKNLINEFSEEPTYSPYLFEPYFEQYESWRDNAMAEAEKHMSKNQDVVIITMDFRRYYYSLDIDENLMSSLLQEAILEEDTDEYKKICHRINLFVGRIISEYSRCFGNAFKGKRILPIGFLPSNIIGNWCLNRFDKAIIDGWNPVYYGRYVDDILIVDKVERNSDIQIKAKSGELTKENIIEFFLTNCSRWNGFKSLDRNNAEKYAIIEENAALTKLAQEEAEQNGISKQCKVYSINRYYNPSQNNKSEIIVQNDKVKIFYFKHDESDALIKCFKNNISKNKSEFRHLPEDEAVFQKDDYSDIYVLSNNDTLNKFRGIDGISLDKFELSKFLGKYLRIGG
ncbi:MAG: hypothetical protein J6M66_01405, partial [Lachnospiraceae bacterium]|nr:hypothetical protein [Lachnospiraceae bacterium]